MFGAAACTAVFAGAVTMLVTLVANPGPWLQGYVSETGTSGQPFATAYRSGLLLLAAGVAFLGLALRPASQPVAALLGIAAFLAAVSGVVSCTNQCPLPPFEPTTVSDVVHTAASIIGMAVLAGVMAMITHQSSLRPAARRLSAVATVLIVPLGATLGLTMLLVGRGTTGAVVERVALAVAVSWLIGLGTLTILRSSVKVESCRTTTEAPRSRLGSPASNSSSRT